MKKKLLCAAALAAGFMFTNIEAKAQSISVGPRLGLNFSKTALTGSDVDDDIKEFYEEGQSMATGIHGGVAINIGLSDMFSVQPELLWSQKGETRELDFGLGKEEITETLNYFQVPILAKATFGEDIKFFVNAGPAFGILMGGKYSNEDEEEDIDKEDYQTLDFSLMGGVGVGINAGPGMFTIEGRYDYGLSGLDAEDDEDEDELNIKRNNRSFGVSISYMFPIGG